MKQRFPSITAPRHSLRVFTVLLGLSVAFFSFAQQSPPLCPPLNLGFEVNGSEPVGWSFFPQVPHANVVTIVTNSAQAYVGKSSLFIHRLVASKQNSFTGVVKNIPGAPLAGKTVTFSGYIKTEKLADGAAVLRWRDNGAEGMLDSANSPSAKGAQDWKRYSLTIRVDPDTTSISFGVGMSGAGMAWFDDLKVEVGPDHVPLAQALTMPHFQPTEAQLDWLKRNSVSLNGTSPEQGFSDLKSLKATIGNARIVGLGGATPGSHEIFQVKDRLIRFLAIQMDFTILATDINMPEARHLNQYVLHGKGDPKRLVERIGFQAWDTQEMLNLIKWMRRYNASGKGKIEFTGFDIQIPTVAMRKVKQFINKVEPNYLSTLKNTYLIVHSAFASGDFEQWKEVAQKVYEHLKAKRSVYLNRANAKVVDRAIQNARIVLQGAEALLPGGPSRDESMAENVEWIAQHNPGARIILWAHDEHIAKSWPETTPMGGYLAKHFGKDYVSLGTVFYQGGYNAFGLRGLTAYTAPPACPGSIGAVFHAVGEPVFLLDLHQVTDSLQGKWLSKPHKFRSIGSVVETDYESLALAKAFNLVIFLDKVTASHFLQ
jgi:erythromycin esterase